jgi:hypothetical protein
MHLVRSLLPKGAKMLKSICAVAVAVLLMAGALAAQPELVVYDQDNPTEAIPHEGILNVGSSTGRDQFTVTVQIHNEGDVDLNLTGMTPVSPQNPNKLDYLLTQPSGASVTPSNFVTFSIDITPNGHGSFGIDLLIASDDPTNDPYEIRIRGNTGTKEKDDSGCSSTERNGLNLLLLLGLASALIVATRLRRPTEA